MFAWIKSFFVSVEIDELEYIDSLSDEDMISCDRIFIPCPMCKRSMVIGYNHLH